MTKAGRLTLVKSVIISQAVYLLSPLRASKDILQFIDTKRKQFLWPDSERLTGGKCKVNWLHSARPKVCSGLGVLHLSKFARALRLRWLWQDWTSVDKTWVASELPCTKTHRLLFAASRTISLGDGKKASFWDSAWLQGIDREILHSVFLTSLGRRVEPCMRP